MYTYLLFDLDGTLTDPKEGITRSVQYALGKMGIKEPDTESLIRFIGPPLSASFMEYYHMTKDEADQAIFYYRERFRPIGIFENAVYDGIHSMLADLKEHGYTIALATSKPEVFAKQILEHFQLTPYFDCIVGSELNGERCLKSEVITEVLHRLAIQTHSEALMIGDRHHDIDGASACGMDAVGVRFGYAKPTELENAGAQYIVNTVYELHQLLLELKGE